MSMVRTLKIDYQNAQGDQSNLQRISQSLIEDNDVMLAIATPAAQSLSSLTKGKPILVYGSDGSCLS